MIDEEVMNMNDEVQTEISAQLENEQDRNTKPKVIVTILKIAGYIISYILMDVLWLAVFVLITFLQYRPDFGDEWGLFLQDKDKLSEFIIAIVKRTYMLNWYILAGGIAWLLLLFLFFRVRKQPILERTGLKKCSPAFLICGVLIGIGSKLLIDGVLSLWPQLNGEEIAGILASAPFKDLYLSDPNTGISALLSILAVGIITPFAEEMIFRGICFRHLQRIWPIPFAAAAISVIFGLMHLSSPVEMLFMALWSILLCLMAYRSGSIVPSILCHMSLNLIAMYRLLNGIKFRADTGIGMFVFGIPVLIVGIFILLRIRPADQNAG
ncbi:MAG: CPBP family intramembrane metalloprotease [Lachnospiraceae bacterium]|nr:CPBP family intramembrane metalloprotease [Lachnospiraceae bacterium]